MPNSQDEYVIVHAETGAPEVLLIEKKKPVWQAGFLNLVGGKVEEGESPEQAAIRELEEESGLKPYLYLPTRMGVIESKGNKIYCITIVLDILKELKPRKEETEVVKWYNWFNVRSNKRLMPNLRVILPLMMMGIDGWTLHDQDLIGKKEGTLSLTIPGSLNY